MSTTLAAPLVPETLGRVHGAVGWVLITTGLAIPVIALALGQIDSEHAQDFVTRGIGSLLFLAGFSWLCTRKSGSRVKAHARIVIGVLLCLVVWSNVNASVRDESALKIALREGLALQQRQSEKFAEFESRFEKLQVGDVLTPATLTSPTGLEFGRTVLGQLRALSAERHSLLKAAASDADRFADSMPTEKSRNLVRQEMKQSMVAGLKYQLDLNRAQTQAADTIEEILNWASVRQGPGMQEVDGELYFADTADLAEYRALTAKLQADADAEVKLTTEAIALKAEIDAKRPASDTEIQAYLNK